MTKHQACRPARQVLGSVMARLAACAVLTPIPLGLAAQDPNSKPFWLSTPPVEGRIQASQIGLVINLDDPYSVIVGEYYIRQRGLNPLQVLRVRFPVKPVLAPAEFAPLKTAIDRRFGPGVQGLALAWRLPWAVACNSITSAVSLGFQADACRDTCAPSRKSAYFNQATALPYTEFRLRPSMLLAASDEVQARRLIDRGVASDSQLGRRFSQPTRAVFASTDDAIRSVRSALFPPSIELTPLAVEVRVETPAHARPRRERGEHLILFQTGALSVSALDSYQFVPGAVADHLTSFGGVLDGSTGQMPATAWIDAGATASYGTVSEPCNHAQKFPHPQLLLQYLLKGSSVLEAYWRSVAWPAQGLFIGEPLAAPFGRGLGRPTAPLSPEPAASTDALR
jgi:uncharacterized protein (TIGR03790 family)